MNKALGLIPTSAIKEKILFDKRRDAFFKTILLKADFQ
jgi:hypothetical protein